jgi:hypothetical protein
MIMSSINLLTCTDEERTAYFQWLQEQTIQREVQIQLAKARKQKEAEAKREMRLSHQVVQMEIASRLQEALSRS